MSDNVVQLHPKDPPRWALIVLSVFTALQNLLCVIGLHFWEDIEVPSFDDPDRPVMGWQDIEGHGYVFYVQSCACCPKARLRGVRYSE